METYFEIWYERVDTDGNKTTVGSEGMVDLQRSADRKLVADLVDELARNRKPFLSGFLVIGQIPPESENENASESVVEFLFRNQSDRI